jgi:transposase
LSTKIHAVIDAHRRPVRLRLSGGQEHDMTQAESLLAGLSPRYVVADKGYDSDPLRRQIRRAGGIPVIPSRKGTRHRRHDRQRYKLRNQVERFINQLKHYRRVATRYDKTDPCYFGFICLASLMTTFQ